MWYAVVLGILLHEVPVACREYALTHHGRKIAKQEFCEGGQGASPRLISDIRTHSSMPLSLDPVNGLH